MKKPARNTVRTLALVLVVSATVAALWLALPREGLLDRATLLVPREQWVGAERLNRSVGNYLWLSANEILLFHRNPDATLTLQRKRVLPPGKAEPATKLPVAPLSQAEIVTLSPDSSTLHILYLRRLAPRGQRMASEYITVKDGRSSGMTNGWKLGTWCDGSDSECECQYITSFDATLHYHDGRSDRQITVNGLAGAPMMRGNVWPLFVQESGRVVALADSYYSGTVTPADKARLGAKVSPVRTFVEFNLNRPGDKGRIWTVPVPPDAASFYCQPSPDHNRLLWIVQSNDMPLDVAITQRLPRMLRRTPRYKCRWTVSDLSGGHMHPIANFTISSLYFSRPDLIAPKWTPDSRHVSFEYNKALYMLAAE